MDQDVVRFDEVPVYKRILERAAEASATNPVDVDELEREERRLNEQTRRMQALDRIPLRFRQCAIDDTRVELWADEFLAHPGNGRGARGLVMTGPVGVGKTGTMWAVYRYLVEAGYAGRIEAVRVVRLLDELKPNGGASIGKLISCDLLLLDDLGAHRATEWAQERLFDLIDARYEDGRPLIVTTNVPFEHFSELQYGIGPRVASRLAIEACEPIKLQGGDRRKRRRGGPR